MTWPIAVTLHIIWEQNVLIYDPTGYRKQVLRNWFSQDYPSWLAKAASLATSIRFIHTNAPPIDIFVDEHIDRKVRSVFLHLTVHNDSPGLYQHCGI